MRLEYIIYSNGGTYSFFKNLQKMSFNVQGSVILQTHYSLWSIDRKESPYGEVLSSSVGLSPKNFHQYPEKEKQSANKKNSTN